MEIPCEKSWRIELRVEKIEIIELLFEVLKAKFEPFREYFKLLKFLTKAFVVCVNLFADVISM